MQQLKTLGALVSFILLLPLFSVATTTSVSAGYLHSCVVRDSVAYCWGWNFYGQLGNDTRSDASGPKAVLDLPYPVIQISGLSSHTCAVADGGAYCWGVNRYGAVGNGTRKNAYRPVQVTGLGKGSGVTKIAAGEDFTCAVVRGGVQCWGWNWTCSLGKKTCIGSQASSNDMELTPRWVDGLGEGSGVVELVAGKSHVCAVVNSGLKCWGWGIYGKTGDGNEDSHYNAVPTDVLQLGAGSGVTSAALGDRHSCALVGGGVKCWGKGLVLGLNEPNNDRGEPTSVIARASRIARISANGGTTCAVKSSGGVLCWGLNYLGQVGNGKNGISETAHTPQKVLGLSSESVSDVSVGHTHVCVATGDTAQCWGSNSSCQLGQGVCGDKLSLSDSALTVVPF